MGQSNMGNPVHYVQFEVIETIHSLKPKKSPGYELITAKIQTELADEGFSS